MLIKNLDILKGISYNCLLSFKGTTFLRNCKIFFYFFAIYVKKIETSHKQRATNAALCKYMNNRLIILLQL